MKIYAYAIISSNDKVNDSICGLENVPVYDIPYRDLGIAVSELNQEIQNITREHILKHEEVIEKLMEDFTVLPMRFHTLFDQKKDALLMMQEYYSDFKENLARLHNKVEFGIKVIWSGETIKNRIIEASKKCHANLAISDNSPAKSFVKEKFEKYKIDREFQEEANRCITLIDDFFSRFVAEKKLEKLKSDNLLLSAAYLVEKDRQADFKEAFERTRRTSSDLKFLLSGPWPCYNFVTLTKKSDSADYFNTEDILNRLLNQQDLL
jgi:glycosyltransferase involved in cell wall biosynthesis